MVSKPSDVGSGTMSHLANLILRQYGVVVALAVFSLQWASAARLF